MHTYAAEWPILSPCQSPRHVHLNLITVTYIHAKFDTFHSAATFNRNVYFESGNGGIFLSDMHCNGSESRLIDCNHSGIGVHNCQHSNDVGLRCLGMHMYTIV